MKQELLKQLKSDYEKLEIKPSADLWSRIEQIDPKEDKSSAMSFKKPFQWWKYAAVLVLLFSVGILLYFNQNHIAPINNTLVHRQQAQERAEPSILNFDIHVAENTETGIKVDKKNTEENLTIPKAYQQEEITQKKEFRINKEEQVIVADYEIKAPILERNMDFATNKVPFAKEKKSEYINADELLQGREFQKKREENRTDIRKFGALDITQIKVKSPNSFKVFGVTVYSDSLESK